VQVNATSANGVDTSRLDECVDSLRQAMASVPEVEWIVQRNEETRPLWEGLTSGGGVAPPNMSVLFDASMGLGKAITEFPAPPGPEVAPRGCGYAGGIGPANVGAVLERVAAAAQGTPVWIDMESSLRTKDDAAGTDVFDLDKCRACVDEYRRVCLSGSDNTNTPKS
jgi:hypothetical protein